MVKWEDTSSWSDFDSKEVRAVPKSWTARIGRFRLTVHRHIQYEPDQWLASCPGVFECVELASKDVEQAKVQAVAKLQVICEDAIRSITE